MGKGFCTSEVGGEEEGERVGGLVDVEMGGSVRLAWYWCCRFGCVTSKINAASTFMLWQ